MNPIAVYFAPYKTIIEVIVFGALAIWLSLAAHSFLEHERDIGRNEVRAEYATKLAEATAAAHQREQDILKQRDEAINNANQRDQTIRTLAASAGASSNSLRDTTNSISNRLSAISGDALREVARAYGDVLTECQARRGSLAEEAERINSEKRTLIEAWPQPQIISSPPLYAPSFDHR